MSKIATLVLAISATAACTRSADESDLRQKYCQADIASKLLNPETAEFHDFGFIPKATAAQQILEWSIAADQEKRESEGLVLPQKPEHNSEVAYFINQQLDSDEKSGAKFAALRVRADSRLGNKVTSEYVCRVWNDHCLCESSDQ